MSLTNKEISKNLDTYSNSRIAYRIQNPCLICLYSNHILN